MREKTVEWALKEKIIAIVRGMEAKDCLRVAQALYDGGIRLMEITYDQRDPAQWAKTADAIGKIAEAFGRELGSCCITNFWVPDGFKDIPFDRLAPRERLRDSLDALFAVKLEQSCTRAAVES